MNSRDVMHHVFPGRVSTSLLAQICSKAKWRWRICAYLRYFKGTDTLCTKPMLHICARYAE
ncbi:MAG TPA: hypothetical protein VIQ23_09215 [Hanamia sp.]